MVFILCKSIQGRKPHLLYPSILRGISKENSLMEFTLTDIKKTKTSRKILSPYFLSRINLGHKRLESSLPESKSPGIFFLETSRIPWKNGVSQNIPSLEYSALDLSVRKFSLLGFYFTENSGIPTT